MKRLDEVCDLEMGQSPDSCSYNEEGRGIPFFQGNTDFGDLYPDTRVWCDKPTKIVEPDTLLISVRAPIGALNFAKERSCIGRGLAGIAAKQDVDLKYIYYYLKYKREELNNKGTGSTFKAIAKNALGEIMIKVLPLNEQSQCTSVLDKISAIINAYKAILYELDNLIQSQFVEMFGDININDKAWEIQPLGELCTIVRGSSPRPIEQFLGGDVPWIKIGDATEGDNIYLNSTREHIISKGVKKSRLVKSGSLIFANCGVSLGFARIITFDGCIHDGWLALEDIDERLNKIFLLQALNQMTEHFRAIAPAGTQPNLNTAIMKAYKQIIPPLALQQEFIAFVEQVDKLKDDAKKSLMQLETLEMALMQQYFSESNCK